MTVTMLQSLSSMFLCSRGCTPDFDLSVFDLTPHSQPILDSGVISGGRPSHECLILKSGPTLVQPRRIPAHERRLTDRPI